MDGFVPTENLRFREASLTFKVAETAMEEEIKRMCRYEYPTMVKNLGNFLIPINILTNLPMTTYATFYVLLRVLIYKCVGMESIEYVQHCNLK